MEEENTQKTNTSVKNKPRAFFIVFIIVVLLVVGGVVFLFRSGLFSGIAGGVAARVNGEEISLGDLNTRVKQLTELNASSGATSTPPGFEDTLRSRAITQLVNESLIVQAAKEEKITVSDDQINAQIKTISGQFKSEDDFKETLLARNLTQESLRSRVARELAIEGYVNKKIDFKKISVTDEEIKSFYDTVSAQQPDIPALGEIRTQVENQIRQQKLSALVNALIEGLRNKADIQVLL